MISFFFEKKNICFQAGVELCQAQVKLESIVEVGVKVRSGVEDGIVVHLLVRMGGTQKKTLILCSTQVVVEVEVWVELGNITFYILAL